MVCELAEVEVVQGGQACGDGACCGQAAERAVGGVGEPCCDFAGADCTRIVSQDCPNPGQDTWPACFWGKATASYSEN